LNKVSLFESEHAYALNHTQHSQRLLTTAFNSKVLELLCQCHTVHLCSHYQAERLALFLAVLPQRMPELGVKLGWIAQQVAVAALSVKRRRL
jgi:hypothetical protein